MKTDTILRIEELQRMHDKQVFVGQEIELTLMGIYVEVDLKYSDSIQSSLDKFMDEMGAGHTISGKHVEIAFDHVSNMIYNDFLELSYGILETMCPEEVIHQEPDLVADILKVFYSYIVNLITIKYMRSRFLRRKNAGKNDA